jgi:predicted component of viral defense system (DUF524 family)
MYEAVVFFSLLRQYVQITGVIAIFIETGRSVVASLDDVPGYPG